MNENEITELIQKIEIILKNVHNTFSSNSRQAWTEKYHLELGKLDPDKFEVYTKLIPNPGYREFMVDFSLSKKKNEKKDDWKIGYEGLVLACETEWGKPDDVIYDFQKLAVIKAKIKLIIFQIENDTVDNFQKYCNDLKKSITLDLLNDKSVYCFFCSGTSFDHRFYRYPEISVQSKNNTEHK